MPCSPERRTQPGAQTSAISTFKVQALYRFTVPPTTPLDTTKFADAAKVMPVAVVDSTPPTYEENDVRPWRLDPANGGVWMSAQGVGGAALATQATLATLDGKVTTATAEPLTSDNTSGIVVRPLTEPWLVKSSGLVLKFLIQNTKTLLVHVRALNPHAMALHVTLHNVADVNNVAEGNRIGLPRTVPMTPGSSPGERSSDFAPIEFSAGLVMAVSTSPYVYVAAAGGQELYFEAHYR